MKDLVAKIKAMVSTTNGANLIGVNYTNRFGEVANHVVILNASYYNACNRAIAVLNTLTDDDFTAIAKKYDVNNVSGIKYATNKGAMEFLSSGKLPKEGTKAREMVLNGVKTTKSLAEVRNEIIDRILKNRDAETRSERSQSEIDKYEYIDKGLKMDRETKEVYIFAKAHSKEVIIDGEYKDSEKEAETLQKEAISKYCNYVLNKELPNELFRKFKVTTEQLHRAKINGIVVTC